MNNSTGENTLLQARFAEVFARLREQDIEQFYAHYQLWLLRRRVPLIEKQIELLREHLVENQQLIDSLQPSAVALAVLARLQSNGVSNIELLDQMLERGEDWLDRMMQRLDYCEQVEDFIQGDYTQWCLNSLEGAYDWIDTLLGSVKDGPMPLRTDEEDVQATAEQLLQKLSLDEDESIAETTPKQPAIQVAQERASASEVNAPQTPAQEEIPVNLAQQIAMDTESTTEAQASADEAAQPAELADWQDLASREEYPAPWYSANLAENAPADAAQPDTINEWITVLQMDTLSKSETDTPESTEHTGAVGLTTPGTQAQAPSEAAATPENEETHGTSEIDHESAERANTAVTLSPASEGETRERNETALAEDVSVTEHEIVAAMSDVEVETIGREIEQPTGVSTAALEEVEPGVPTEEAPVPATVEEAAPVPMADEEETRAESTVEIKEQDLTVGEAERVEAAAPEHQGKQEIDHAPAAAVEVQENTTTDAVIAPESNTPGPGEGQEAGASREREKAEQGNAIEEATGANDVLGMEEGEELPWYEYLEMGGQANQEPQKQSVAEEWQSAIPAEPREDALVDQSVTGITSAEPALPANGAEQQEQALDEVREWQSNETRQENDETLPMALREIRLAQKHAVHDTAEAEAAAASEIVAPNTPGDKAESEQAALVQGSTTTPATSTETTSEEGPAREENKVAAETLAPQVVPVAQAAPASEEPRAKIGFWRRLFGKWRKKQT